MTLVLDHKRYKQAQYDKFAAMNAMNTVQNHENIEKQLENAVATLKENCTDKTSTTQGTVTVLQQRRRHTSILSQQHTDIENNSVEQEMLTQTLQIAEQYFGININLNANRQDHYTALEEMVAEHGHEPEGPMLVVVKTLNPPKNDVWIDLHIQNIYEKQGRNSEHVFLSIMPGNYRHLIKEEIFENALECETVENSFLKNKKVFIDTAVKLYMESTNVNFAQCIKMAEKI